MSNTIFAFLKKDKVPDRESLQATINKLGFDLQLDLRFTPFEDNGFSPCLLNGESDIGFEIFYETTEDIVENDEEFQEIASDKDFCISLTWGGSLKDCASAMIVSTALAKDYEAIVSYNGYDPDPLEQMIADCKAVLEDVLIEEKIEVEKKKVLEKIQNDDDIKKVILEEFENLIDIEITSITTARGKLIIQFSNSSILKAQAFTYTNRDNLEMDSTKYAKYDLIRWKIYESLDFEDEKTFNETEKKLRDAEKEDQITDYKLKTDIASWPNYLRLDKIDWSASDTVILSFKNLENIHLRLLALDSNVHYISFETELLDYKIKSESCEITL